MERLAELGIVWLLKQIPGVVLLIVAAWLFHGLLKLHADPDKDFRFNSRALTSWVGLGLVLVLVVFGAGFIVGWVHPG